MRVHWRGYEQREESDEGVQDDKPNQVESLEVFRQDADERIGEPAELFRLNKRRR